VNDVYGRRLRPTEGVKLSGASQEAEPYADTTLESPYWAPKVHGIDDSLSLRQKDRDGRFFLHILFCMFSVPYFGLSPEWLEAGLILFYIVKERIIHGFGYVKRN
jgi:hypothetical protein